MNENHTKVISAWQNRFRATVIIIITCLCGWFIMSLEILGVRVLAPYFGSAVYVVTGSVIGVFLLSLSGGYMFGGWLSHKKASRTILGINITAAGIWMCALPFIIEPVCEMLFNTALNEKFGSLLASVILFGTPTMLLATASPTAIRWLTRKPSDSGFNAGLVLCASTVASFAGCVVTAFYLILLSIRVTICTSGAVLMLLGLAILLQDVAQKLRTKPNPDTKK